MMKSLQDWLWSERCNPFGIGSRIGPPVCPTPEQLQYLDKHFGINQVTSYRSVECAQLKGQVEDRDVKSAARKALALSQKQVTERLKRNLLAEEQACQAHQHSPLILS